MKLRIRAVDSKQTTRIEIPEDSSLQTLKDSIAGAIGFPSPSSLRLSLNRSDELSPSAPEVSLLSLGISAGDLIFFSVASDGAPLETLAAPVSSNSDQVMVEGMEIGDEDDGDRFLPVSCFVKRLVRVLQQNEDEDEIEIETENHMKFMISAVHSVFLESGFVLLSDKRLRFPSSMAFAVSFRYTLPEIVAKEGSESVVLKFQSMKSFVNVFGSCSSASSSSSSSSRACLDTRRFAPVIIAALRSTDRNFDSEREVFELWRVVRDSLALPMMIDICSEAGLEGPACFARLPSELHLRILELLPGPDVARVGSVCRELRYLSLSSDELWKRKFEEEFGADTSRSWPTANWRIAFAKRWSEKRRRKRTAVVGPRIGWLPWTGGQRIQRWTTFSPDCDLGGEF